MKRSGIITLTTDFGLTDPYVAMMKGVILSVNPGARIVDISHRIKAGFIHQGAGIIYETFPYFPPGTVHVAVVDPGVGSKRRLMGIEAGGHFFVGPDNGIFWHVIQAHRDISIVHLTKGRFFTPPKGHTFHGRDVFAPVAAHISLGVDLGQMGKTIIDPVKLDTPIPQKKGNTLYGQVVRVDNFGNLITNIRHEELKRFIGSAQPVIRAGNLLIKSISRIYADREEGEPLALINSSDYLEIAVNLGRASDYIGIEPGEILNCAVKVEKLAAVQSELLTGEPK